MPAVTTINPIEVPKGREQEALLIWERYAEYFRRQPGYIGTSLNRSLDPNARFHLVNVAQWESAEHFLAALNNEEIKKVGAGFPPEMPHYPSIYEVIRS